MRTSKPDNYLPSFLVLVLLLALGYKAQGYLSNKFLNWRDSQLTKELNELFDTVKPKSRRNPNEPIEWSNLTRPELEQLTYSAMKDAALCRDMTESALASLNSIVPDCDTAKAYLTRYELR